MVRERRTQTLPRRAIVGATSFIGVWIVGLTGCGDDAAAIFNRSFINTLTASEFPLAPRPENGFILVRVVNSAQDPIRFLVTVERQTIVGEGDERATVLDQETVELFTQPGANVNEAGVLFECSPEEPILRIGLGRNLNKPQSDPALFVGGVAAGTPGFGVPSNKNPLSSEDGLFQCGDTVIFRAIVSTNSVGGFRVESFVIPWESQPEDVGKDTFGSVRRFLNEGRREEE